MSMLLGSPAPPIDLPAVATGREFRLSDHRDRYVLLIFVAAYGAKATRDVVISVRRRYPEFDQLPIAIIIDMGMIPKLLHRTVTGFMEAAYREAAAQIPPGFKADDHLILLPDWSGSITREYAIKEISNEVHLVLVSPQGNIAAAYRGRDASNDMLTHLQKVMG
jgi:hypothetical protein